MILGLALVLGLFDPVRGAHWREHYGFGWTSLAEGRVLPLLGSTFLVDGFSQWLRIALLLTWSVGVHEWRAGTQRAVLVFAVTNVASCLGAAAVQGAVAVLAGPELDFVRSRDVGASAGAFGCLGAVIAGLRAPWRARLTALTLLYLALKMAVFLALSSDVTHGIAFALGYAWSTSARQADPSSLNGKKSRGSRRRPET